MNIARRGLAIIAAVVVLGSACGGGDDSESDDAPTDAPTSEQACGDGGGAECTPPAQPPSRFRSLADFASQPLDWAACGDFECGSVEVPVDYANPSGDTVELELKRAPATGHSVGTLFINPGGPGASGVDYVDTIASELSEQMRSRYDIVGFDPRGVGESDPLVCLDDDQLDQLVSYDPDPDTAAEEARARNLVAGLGEACADEGELASHVSTVEVARDLDILRSAVGDQKLTYYGASYGTYIGATYAELFPHRVGRMVLDGAVDPKLSAVQINIQQAAGFQTALEAYVDDCIAGGSCPLGSDRDTAMNRIRSFLDDLDQHPIDSGDPDRPLTEALGFYGIALPLYSRDYWPLLTQGLAAAFDGDGSLLLRYADTYLSRTSSGYIDNSAQVIYAVNCLDRPARLSNDEIRRSVPRYEKASPVFGRVFAWTMLSCSEWPLKPSEPAPAIDGAGAPPIVVVGTTRDPATPYHWAESLASELKSGVLVSRDGDGHTGYHVGNSCVDNALDRYFVDGDVPDDGLSC